MSVIVNYHKNNIEIYANIIFYGTYAEPTLALKITTEISSMWNAPSSKITVNGIEFPIIFKIEFEIESNENVVRRIFNNQDFANNFIRIEEKNVSERSMMGFGLGGNSGHWIISDNLGESTTAAHEFGHAMGLPHPDNIDYRNTGTPPIMAPRGTIVDAEYQWNPMAEPATFGGTMKPIYRQVKDYEVLAILENNVEKTNVGVLTNMLFDEIGQPLRIIADQNIT